MAFQYNDIDAVNEAKLGRQRNEFQYPLENTVNLRAQMRFQAVKILPADITAGFSAEQWDEARTGNLDLKDLAEAAKGASQKFQLGDVCKIYMPQALQIQDMFSIDTPSLGVAGGLALNALQGGGGVSAAVAGAVNEGTQSISDFVGMLAGSGEVGRVAAVRGASLVNDTAGNVASIATQTAMNPNIRAVFKQVNLREFSFNFKFIPVSGSEAKEVRDIIAFFRWHAYPKNFFDEGNKAGIVAYEYPYMFRIKSMVKATGSGGQFIVQPATEIKDCFLRNISTSYNPTMQTYHADGQPTEIDLTLHFIEHRTLHRGDIERPGEFQDLVSEQRIEPSYVEDEALRRLRVRRADQAAAAAEITRTRADRYNYATNFGLNPIDGP
jgi:hypothetical protein